MLVVVCCAGLLLMCTGPEGVYVALGLRGGSSTIKGELRTVREGLSAVRIKDGEDD